MTTTRSLLTTVTLVLSATASQALEFTGAEASLEYRDAQDRTFQTHFEASGALSFGSGFGAQIGLKNDDYAPGGSDSFGFEAHGTYALSDAATVGLVYGRESFGSDFKYYGVEAAYSLGMIALDTSLTRYRGDFYDATYVTLDGAYTVGDKISLLAGYHRGDDGSPFDYTYVGAEYAVGSGVGVLAKYGDGDTSGRVLSLGLNYTFGQGVGFAQRSYTNFSPADSSRIALVAAKLRPGRHREGTGRRRYPSNR